MVSNGYSAAPIDAWLIRDILPSKNNNLESSSGAPLRRLGSKTSAPATSWRWNAGRVVTIERLTNQMLATTGAKPIDRVLDLEPRLRCRECDAKGRPLCRSGGRPI